MTVITGQSVSMAVSAIDLTDGFDYHDYREDLKLIEQTRDSAHLENRGGLACPACGRPFDAILATTARSRSLPGIDGPFCLARTDERLLVMTHSR